MHPLLLLQREAAQRAHDIETDTIPPEEFYYPLDCWDPSPPLPVNVSPQQLSLVPLSPTSSSSSFSCWNSEPSIGWTPFDTFQDLAMPQSPLTLQALEAMSTPYPELEISDDYGLLQGSNDVFPDMIPPLSYVSGSSSPPIPSSPPHQWPEDPVSQHPDAKRARRNHTSELPISVSELTLSPPKQECPKCGRPLRRSHSTGLYRCGKCGPRGTRSRRLHDNTKVNREDGPSHRGEMRSPTHSNNSSEGSLSFATSPRPDVKHDPEPFEMLLENYEPPELIVRGLVSPKEVCQLFEIFFDKMNDANTLDRTIHNIPSLLTRCPFLFTVICAIASSALPSRPDLYPVAISLAKAEASKALSVREKGPYTSPEAALALKLMARWARRSCPSVQVTI